MSSVEKFYFVVSGSQNDKEKATSVNMRRTGDSKIITQAILNWMRTDSDVANMIVEATSNYLLDKVQEQKSKEEKDDIPD